MRSIAKRLAGVHGKIDDAGKPMLSRSPTLSTAVETETVDPMLAFDRSVVGELFETIAEGVVGHSLL